MLDITKFKLLVTSMTGIRARTLQEKTEEYGQEILLAAELTNGIRENEREAIEMMQKLSTDGFEKLMEDNKLDAMVMPGWVASTVLAIGGYPAISVPAGYDIDEMHYGICFGGLKGTEPKLIEIAYGFEQATRVRKSPFSKSYDFVSFAELYVSSFELFN